MIVFVISFTNRSYFSLCVWSFCWLRGDLNGLSEYACGTVESAFTDLRVDRYLKYIL